MGLFKKWPDSNATKGNSNNIVEHDILLRMLDTICYKMHTDYRWDRDSTGQFCNSSSCCEHWDYYTSNSIPLVEYRGKYVSAVLCILLENLVVLEIRLLNYR